MRDQTKRLGLGIALAAMVSLAAVSDSRAEDAYSEAKLESFVVAALAVNQVIEDWGPKIQSAESDQQAESMAREAGEEMRTVVDQTDGITVEEYQAIVEAVQSDAELKGRIDGILQDQRQP